MLMKGGSKLVKVFEIDGGRLKSMEIDRNDISEALKAMKPLMRPWVS